MDKRSLWNLPPVLATLPRDQWLPFPFPLWERCGRTVLKVWNDRPRSSTLQSQMRQWDYFENSFKNTTCGYSRGDTYRQNHYLPWRTAVRKRIIKEVYGSYTGTFHCHEILVSSSHVPKGYLFFLKEQLVKTGSLQKGRKITDTISSLYCSCCTYKNKQSPEC